ncbi:MAG: TVP38/TMEM64 family protein [Planctomycetes bacterium]|nr:TVP38/TMEM64 family protein [Planctomycetota bacterium]
MEPDRARTSDTILDAHLDLTERADGADTSTPPEPLTVWRPIALALLALGCVALFSFTSLGERFSLSHAQELVEQIRAQGAAAPIVFTGAGALAVALGVPRTVPCCVGGALFGFWGGSVLSVLSSLLGSAATFLVGRQLGREFVENRVRSKFRRLDSLFRFVKIHGVSACAFLRLVPVGHCFSLNLILSVSPISFGAFLAGSAIGFLPQSMACAWMGTAVHGESGIRIATGIALLTALSIAGWWWMRRLRRNRASDSSPGGSRIP